MEQRLHLFHYSLFLSVFGKSYHGFTFRLHIAHHGCVSAVAERACTNT